MYPKDTVTQKQLDRKVDRLEMRFDHHINRLRRLTKDVRLLQSQITHMIVFMRSLTNVKEEE